jgi:hypothetical protein
MLARSKLGVPVRPVGRFEGCSKYSLGTESVHVLYAVCIAAPFSIWIIFSLSLISPLLFLLLPRLMRLASTFTDAISLTMTAMRSPWSGDCRMCRSKVVFPLPCYCQSTSSYFANLTNQKSRKDGYWERLSLAVRRLRLHLRTASLSSLRRWHMESLLSYHALECFEAL